VTSQHEVMVGKKLADWRVRPPRLLAGDPRPASTKTTADPSTPEVASCVPYSMPSNSAQTSRPGRLTPRSSLHPSRGAWPLSMQGRNDRQPLHRAPSVLTQTTYPTEGMKRVIGEVFGRLSGDNATRPLSVAARPTPSSPAPTSPSGATSWRMSPADWSPLRSCSPRGGGVPAETGFTAATQAGREISMTFDADIGRAHDPFIPGELIRVLNAVGGVNGKTLELRPWSKIFRLPGASAGNT